MCCRKTDSCNVNMRQVPLSVPHLLKVSHVPRALFPTIASYMCPVPRCQMLNAHCSQVSEDHCWLNTDPEAGREGTIEVTTDSAAKRALPVDAAAWQGWLYSGGHAPLCSHQVLSLPMTWDEQATRQLVFCWATDCLTTC